MGDESGYVRFEEPEAGQKARAAAVLAEEGGLIVKNYIAFFEAVVGMYLCPSLFIIIAKYVVFPRFLNGCQMDGSNF